MMASCCQSNRRRGGTDEVPDHILRWCCCRPRVQSYGDTAREIIANSYPQLGWLAPQTAVAQTVPDTIVPSITSPDRQELRVMSFDLAALRQRVDEIAAGQDRIARDITTKLQAAEQDILDKISVPPPQAAAAPARKSAPPPLQLAPSR